MKKTVLSSNDVKTILETVWNDSDIEIECEEFGEIVRTSCNKTLQIGFYCFKQESARSAYALVKANGDEAMIQDSADFCRKGASVKFLIGENKAHFLDAYVKNLRAKYFGKPLDLEVAGVKVKYLEFGTLQYEKPPENTAIGRAIICSMEMKITYAANVAVSGDKVWLLDGVELPYIRESVDLEKLGITNNIYGAKATQTLPTGQSKFYSFTLPYITDNTACIRIQREILEGDMTQLHDLTYYDGITYRKEAPFAAKVTLYRTLRSSARVAENAEFEVTFTDADDGLSGDVLYEMALIDNPFDSGSINTRWFPNRAEQQEWFADKVAKGAPYSIIKAPNLNNMTITQQIYTAQPGSPLDLNALLTKNYAIIRASDKKAGDILYYYYYYVQSASVGANNQIVVTLQMDTIQTYYFDPDIDIAECTIQRAHLNRWVDNGDGIVSFDNGPSSAMLNSDGANLPKRLIVRDKLAFNFDTSSTRAIEFFTKWDIGWLFVFIDPKFQETGALNNQGKPPTLKVGNTDLNLVVFIAPIINAKVSSSKEPYFSINTDKITTVWNAGQLFDWITAKNLSNYVLNMKISPICPFKVGDHKSDYEIVNQARQFSISGLNNLNLFCHNSGEYGAIMALKCQSESPAFCDYELPICTQFFKNEIINSKPIDSFNPKFLSERFIEAKISDYAGNTFSYDLQKINSNRIKILINEAITSDITKGYIRIQDNKNSCFGNGCERNFTGLVYSNDTSIPYSIEQLSAFLSQNKNYSIMQQAQRDYSQDMVNIQKQSIGIKGMLSAASNIGQGNYLNAITNIGETAIDNIMSQKSIDTSNALSQRMEAMTLDNMRAAPSNIKNAQGNILFCDIIDSTVALSMYIEFYKFIPADGEKINDYMNLYGFTFQRLGGVKEYDHIRHYFNFIQADIESIGGITMSNDARNDIRRRFEIGIRFWNINKVDYERENYENWIAN